MSHHICILDSDKMTEQYLHTNELCHRPFFSCDSDKFFLFAAIIATIISSILII